MVIETTKTLRVAVLNFVRVTITFSRKKIKPADVIVQDAGADGGT
jgi:hypothetical protein